MLVRDTIDPARAALYPVVTPDMSVQSVASAMAEGRVGAALVFDGGALAGIFTERDLISRVLGKGRLPSGTATGDVMTAVLDIHDHDVPIFPALEMMIKKHYRHALVRTDAAGAIKVTTQKNVIRSLWGQLTPRKKNMLCKKYLAADIVQRHDGTGHCNIIEASASAQRALEMMMERRTGSLLVTHEGLLCGIFTERDVLIRLVAARLHPESCRLINVSTLTPNVITPEVNIGIIMRLLLEKNYRRVPITLMGKPLGMVTQRHIAYLLRDEFSQIFRRAPWNA